MSNTITTLRDVQENDELIQAILDSGKIGQLCRKGRTVYYANLEPLHLGLTVEGTTRFDVAAKLLSHASR
jgi:hypothetical protein